MVQKIAKKSRTWTAFGDIKRKPNQYEVLTHGMNYTLRPNVAAPLESNPTSPMNMWLKTYRDQSPLHIDDWDTFRDPDRLIYTKYVNMQNTAENEVTGIIEKFNKINHDQQINNDLLNLIAKSFTPQRYLVHGYQLLASYLAHTAPSSYITNVAAFSAGDTLRRNSLVALRTKMLQDAHPSIGFGLNEKEIWEKNENWQPIRLLIEHSLIAYDWGESLVSVNLMTRTCLDGILLQQLGLVCERENDKLTWLIISNIYNDSVRLTKWTKALIKHSIDKNSKNINVIQNWVNNWYQKVLNAADSGATLVTDLNTNNLNKKDVFAAGQDKLNNVLDECGLKVPTL